MKLCSKGCVAICDFCIEYKFNGDDSGVYLDNGFCKHWNLKKDPTDSCDDFVCVTLPGGKRRIK